MPPGPRSEEGAHVDPSMTRVAWVTGGGSGLGRALALEMAHDGWRVAVSGRRRGALQETCSQGPAGRIHAFPCDVRDEAAMTRCARDIEAGLGALRLAVFNAGVADTAPDSDFQPAVFRRTLEINVLGTVNGIAAVLPGMRQRRGGHIAMTASLAGYRGLPTAAAYSASKAAMINLAESLRLQLRGDGIRVSVINPGFVRTPMTGQNAFPMPFLMEPEPAAKAMYAGLMRGAFEITFPKRLAWTAKLLKALPYALYFPLLRRAAER